MYYVIGNSPKKVELKDLNDCVYYKQQKVYSDSQHASSVDLQRAIERKALIVLKKSEDNTGSFDVDSAVISSDIKTSDSSPKIDLLLDKINKLEEKIKSQSSPSAKSDESALATILDRLEKLEKGNTSSVDLSSIQEALKNIETRMQENNSDDILKKLESIISKASSVTTTVMKQEEEKRVEDVYVPNINVEDGTSHINLEVRTIESGNSLADSLKKLKELKSKSK